jgi:hypothetical protein
MPAKIINSIWKLLPPKAGEKPTLRHEMTIAGKDYSPDFAIVGNRVFTTESLLREGCTEKLPNDRSPNPSLFFGWRQVGTPPMEENPDVVLITREWQYDLYSRAFHGEPI